MKLFLKNLFAFCFGLAIFSSQDSWADEAQIIFCEDINVDDWSAINPSNAIEGTQFSWFFKADEPFNTTKILISVYKNENNTSELLAREEMDVNPKWDVCGFKYWDFEEYGSYEIAINKLDGAAIASGEISLVETTKEIDKKPLEKVGGELEELFNKYMNVAK